MRKERLARTLLRLYPRAWRERYGDEFLAFVADSELSWRAVADVVFAATVERARAVVALARHEVDPTASLPPVASRSVREALAESGGFVALVGLTVWAISTLGVPYPRWLWWFNIVFMLDNHSSSVLLATQASWSERLLIAYFRFAVAATVAGLGLLTGDALSRLGLPAPSERTALWIGGIFLVSACVRMFYCIVRTSVYGSTWPGVHRREIQAWKVVLFLVIVVLNMVGPPGEAFKAFWGLAFVFWMSLRPPPFALTRAGAARRRAEHEAMERRAFGA